MRESEAIHSGLRIVRVSRRMQRECVDCMCYLSVYSRATRCDYCKSQRTKLLARVRANKYYRTKQLAKGGERHDEHLRRQRMRYRKRFPLGVCRDCGDQVHRKNAHRCRACARRHRRRLATARMQRYIHRRREELAVKGDS